MVPKVGIYNLIDVIMRGCKFKKLRRLKVLGSRTSSATLALELEYNFKIARVKTYESAASHCH